MEKSLVIAVTGASGVHYALRLLSHLERLDVHVDLLASAAGAEVLRREVDPDRLWIADGKPVLADFGLSGRNSRSFTLRDFGAPCASGTGLGNGMIIIPASMGTVGRLAAGISSNLIERAADVCLKEKRQLTVVCRETPVSTIHLRNMLTLAEAGATVLPASPGFYNNPKSIDDLLDHVCAKVLATVGINNDLITPWGSDQ